jgi:hypothetical protein
VQLNRVLALVDELQQTDTSGVAPMSHALESVLPGGQRLRPDAVVEPDRREEFLAIAPASTPACISCRRSSSSLLNATLAELGSALAAKRISSVELTELFLREPPR